MKRKNNNLFLNSDNDEISMLAEIKTEALEGETEIDINKDIPVIPLRNMVMFPQVVMPITVGRVSTQKLVNAAFKNSQLVAVVCQNRVILNILNLMIFIIWVEYHSFRKIIIARTTMNL